MKKIWIIVAIVTTLLVVGAAGLFYLKTSVPDPFVGLFEDNCSSCHGSNLEGTSLGPALVGVELKHGDSVAEISASIAKGFFFETFLQSGQGRFDIHRHGDPFTGGQPIRFDHDGCSLCLDIRGGVLKVVEGVVFGGRDAKFLHESLGKILGSFKL